VPAPAVIPAPRAYINAAAVKGFVVELRPAKQTFQSPRPSTGGRRPTLLQRREHTNFSETKNTGTTHHTKLKPRIRASYLRPHGRSSAGTHAGAHRVHPSHTTTFPTRNARVRTSVIFYCD